MQSRQSVSSFELRRIHKDFVVIGAGMPGIVAAVQAARLGLEVALVGNRGYLGGNASAEIGRNMDGAVCASELNCYSLEGGILHELLLENLWYNPQGNFYLWEATLRDFIKKIPNLEVWLHTHVDEVVLDGDKTIISVSGSQQGSEIRYEFTASLFLDDTGDGTVGYLAGVDHRVGSEAANEFNERLANEKADDRVLLSTLPFFAHDTGRAVRFKAPDFAVNIEKSGALEHRAIPQSTFYENQWFYQAGAGLDQIKESQKVIEEQWALVFGIWDHVKNSGEFPAANYDLHYVGSIPGKRESRRLMGEHVLCESEIVEQRPFADAVGHGGRAIDLHAFGGFFSDEPENKYYLLRGIYQIPYRCGYSRKVKNLFFAGRSMSCTHAAFGSLRVIGTLCALAQPLGAAAYLCKTQDCSPHEVLERSITELQQLLLREDHFIPGVRNQDPEDLALRSGVSASSSKTLNLKRADTFMPLEDDCALIFPIVETPIKTISLLIRSRSEATLDYELYEPDRTENWTPDLLLASGSLSIDKSADACWLALEVNAAPKHNKAVLVLKRNPALEIAMTGEKPVGVISAQRSLKVGARVFDAVTLEKKESIWQQLCGSICFDIEPVQDVYGPANVINGYARPYGLPNVWIAGNTDHNPSLDMMFEREEEISAIYLYFDADFNIDHLPLPQTGPGYARVAKKEANAEGTLYYRFVKLGSDKIDTVPTLVRDYEIECLVGSGWKRVARVENNRQRLNRVQIRPVRTKALRFRFLGTNGVPEVSVFEIRVYGRRSR